MHFRHFLISTGLILGAAIFLPGNAFAEKDELSGQQYAKKVSVQANAQAQPNAQAQSNAAVQPNTPIKTDNTAAQTNIPAKAENAKSPVKTVEVPNKPAQGGAKQQPAKPTLPQAASEKPAAASQILPDQAKGNGQSAIKKAEKAVQALGTEKAAALQESNGGVEEDKPTPKNADLHSLQQTDTEVENRAKPAVRSIKKVDAQGEGPRLSLSKKADLYEPVVSDSQKKGQVPAPASKEEIPTVNQVMNPTQRTNSSGGQSNDRVSNGLNTISLMDKWFEWNKHYEVKFIRSYLSQHLVRNNQWVNAPPLPPPQEAPLLKTVNRS